MTSVNDEPWAKSTASSVNGEVWNKLMTAAYETALEYYLQPDPLMEQWRLEHEAWWAKQSRWFKIRYRVRTKVPSFWLGCRQRIADWIYPEGRAYYE